MIQGSCHCGAMADQLPVNCWGTRLLRSITHWPTNIAAGIEDITYFAAGACGDWWYRR